MNIKILARLTDFLYEGSIITFIKGKLNSK